MNAISLYYLPARATIEQARRQQWGKHVAQGLSLIGGTACVFVFMATVWVSLSAACIAMNGVEACLPK